MYPTMHTCMCIFSLKTTVTPVFRFSHTCTGWAWARVPGTQSCRTGSRRCCTLGRSARCGTGPSSAPAPCSSPRAWASVASSRRRPTSTPGSCTADRTRRRPPSGRTARTGTRAAGTASRTACPQSLEGSGRSPEVDNNKKSSRPRTLAGVEGVLVEVEEKL